VRHLTSHSSGLMENNKWLSKYVGVICIGVGRVDLRVSLS